MELKQPKMTEDLLAAVNSIFNREIDPIYRQVVKRISPEMENSAYFPWILALKFSPEGARVLLALPDPQWQPGMGEYEVSDAFVQSLGIDDEFVKQTLKDAYLGGELKFDTRTGPDIMSGHLGWIDCQNSQRQIDRYGPAYFKAVGIWAEQEHQPLVAEKNAKARRKASKILAQIVPRYDAVKDILGLLPVENYKEVLKSQRQLLLKRCGCRDLNPEYQQNPTVCMFSKDQGEALHKRDIGQMISWEEAFEHIRMLGKKQPMVSIVKNCMELSELGQVFCNCFADSCFVIRGTMLNGGEFKVWDFYNKTRFRVTFNIDKCQHCNLCLQNRCMFGAIQTRYYKDHQVEEKYINEKQCMGCGNCVETCPSGALTMKLVDPPEALLGYYKDIDGKYMIPNQ